MNKEKALIFIAFPSVIICGVVGLLIEGYDFLNALFFTFIMFLGNYSDPVTNVLINIARYGAITLTATTVFLFFQNTVIYVKDYLNSKKEGSIFLYGDNEYTKDFKESCSDKLIQREKFMETDKYVLLDDEKSNLKFYNENKEILDKKQVYIKSEIFPNQILNNGNLRFFSIEQLAAKRYWEQNLLLPLAKQGKNYKKELSIVFIGFNNFAEEVLYQSLMVNIFSPKQVVKYYIFDDNVGLIKNHKNISKLNIKCFEDAYINHMDIVNKADKILYFDDLPSLIKCIGILKQSNITFFTKETINNELLNNHRYGINYSVTVNAYNYAEEICCKENIINEKEVEAAKTLNAAYEKQMGHIPDKEQQWKELSTFHKFSNLSGVDFFNNTVIKILEHETGKSYKDITDDEFMKYIKVLGELEHIRWMNYHLFCNWDYNKTTYKKHKEHNCLVPFNKLPKAEKTKDENQIQFLREIFRNE